MKELKEKCIAGLCTIAFVGIILMSLYGHYMYPDLLINAGPYSLNPML